MNRLMMMMMMMKMMMMMMRRHAGPADKGGRAGAAGERGGHPALHQAVPR
jgi:hypothetical protein